MISVGSNIVEGCGRTSPREFAQFLAVALGSANEVTFQLELSERLGYLDASVASDLVRRADDVRRMLSMLLRRSHAGGTKTRLTES